MKDTGLVEFNVEVDLSAFEDQLNKIFNSATMLQINNELARLINPWVPFREGVLSQSINVTPEYIEYYMPYAHYQYWGININEENRTRTYHPLATSRWDEVAMQSKMADFEQIIMNIITRRSRELNGNG